MVKASHTHVDEQTDIPILIATKERKGVVKVWCKYCKATHYHSEEEGHRAAHCSTTMWPKKASPYKEGGYNLCILPDIGDVVSRYVKLEKKGRNYFGLCPFHEEDQPSFSINKQKQIFYCFGCGEGGNVVDFVEKIESCDGVDALGAMMDAGFKVSAELYELFSYERFA